MEKQREEPSLEISNSLCHHDTMLEILCRLPHKPLCRFKAVSKGWHNVISGDEFLRTYYYLQTKKHSMTNSSTNGIIRKFHRKEATSSTLRNARRPPVFSGLFAQGRRGVYCSKLYSSASLSVRKECEGIRSNPSLGFLLSRGEEGFIKPLQSCNGLLLCRKTITLRDKNNNTRECHSLHVCNPLTKQHIKLPSSPNHSSWYGMVDLDFDPNYSGFDFRVVRIAGTEKEKHTLQIDYYISGSGSWREHKLIVPAPTCDWIGSMNGRIGFLNNVVFWQPFGRSSLIVYRLGEQHCQEVKLPGTAVNCLTAFWKNQGQLYFYRSWYDGIQMWALITEDFKEFRWELRHSISNESLIENNLDVACATLHHGPNSRYDHYIFEAFDYDFDLGILFLLFFVTIVSYDLRSGKVEVVQEFKFKKWTRIHYDLIPYQHSWALFRTGPRTPVIL